MAMTDISATEVNGQLRAAQDDLREQLLFQSSLLESIPVAIYYKDCQGRYLGCNRAYEEILGKSRSEIVGKSVFDLAPPEIADKHHAMDAELFRQPGRQVYEWVIQKPTGEIRNVVFHKATFLRSDGAVGGLIGALVDITELKQSEDQLRASEAALKAAQRLASIGNWTWDLRTDRHVWSEEVYRIYGRDPALPPAIFQMVEQYFAPESGIRLPSDVEKGMGKGVPFECDAEVVRSDGTHRWVTIHSETSHDADGDVVGLFGTVQDITERKQAEEEIRRLNADLERRVVDRTAELTAANHELDTFAYAVSHDLRAPLRAMSGFSQALVEDYGDRLDGEAKNYLHQIDIASSKMGQLIDGILVLSRCTRGELQRNRIDISALATHLLEELAHGEPERKVDWRVEPNLRATADERMIEAALGNLLGNAWKYTGRTEAPAIRVFLGEVDGRRGFCVADNGAGFDMGHAERLFQPFQRLHRQDEFPGLGIGLATVHRIVHRHGGEICAEGRPGAGATFCFTLPASVPEETS
jgi:PAS domain S-box-containing protein